jgi:hypothetical protein
MPTLASDLLAALDPLVLARRVGLVPDPWQAEMLRSDARAIILNCSRQVGKSAASAVLASHTALYEPASLSIVLGPSERQATELLRTTRGMLAALGEDAPELETDNTLSLQLANGSRVLALPGKDTTIRGFSNVRLLIVDEASRVPDPLYHSVRPMLAVSGGRLVLLSTPFGKRGFFHREWTEGEGWDRYRVPAVECPRISHQFLAAEQRSLPRDTYAQEYECAFIEASGSLFAGDDLAAMFGDTGDDYVNDANWHTSPTDEAPASEAASAYERFFVV